MQHSTDVPTPPPDVTEEKGEGEDGTRQAVTLTHEMIEQETQLWKKSKESI